MRKALIAIAVATALFAVGAFAASLTVQSEDVASGGNAVTACADNVDIDFGGLAWDGTLNGGLGDWTTSSAVVTLYSGTVGTGTVATACEAFGAVVRVQSGAASVESTRGEITSGTTTVSFTATPVNPITRASVLIDGAELIANP